ncbi:Kv channel-interacting protein 1-like isoform X1 [Panonychus citri]|uniref:Kv channel-interacting protein 1-like isoform X1 n=1 Tax=Panonychus citri TaxID=50023 RepID=UPI002307E1E1|nr:Kv channel-interacting protein 1-like isoform X1 [Panonychus citri]
MSKIFSISYTKQNVHHSHHAHQQQIDEDSSDDADDSPRSMDSGDSATAIRIKRFPFEKKSPKKDNFSQKVENLTPKHLRINQAIKDARTFRNWMDRTYIAIKGFIKSKTEKRRKSLDSALDSVERDFDDLDGQQVHIKPEPIEVLCQLTKFSKQELQIMYRGFKQDCPSGVVKEDMFKVIYAQFFPRGSDPSSYAHYVFNSFDPDHTGSITFTDFVVGLSALARGSVQDKLRWAFNLYDLNGDGVLTKDEFSLIVSAVYDLMGKSVEFVLDGKEQTERVFRKFDQKQKGTINLQEFIDSCLKDESITKSLAALDTIF